jgi:hypothetical protein
MTRTQLLQLLIGQARTSGFEFRRWYVGHTGMPWTGAEEAIRWLARGRRAHMLVFSHVFAQAFFRSGDRITFVVPHQTFQSARSSGEPRTIERKAHLRRSSRKDVWLYHVSEMARAAEPLRYLRRYLLTEETMSEEVALPVEIAVDYDEELMVRDAG